MTTPADVVAAARGELGTPWMFQGRLPGVALDCLGLVAVAAERAGLPSEAWDIRDYGRQNAWELIERFERAHLTRLAAIELGAVVIVVPPRGDMPHIGIVGDYRHGGWSLIHSSNMVSPARVVETRLMPRIAVQVRGIFKIPGIN